MTEEKSRFKVSIEAVLWAIATVILFDGLFDATLYNGDDSIYADMARTAWQNGDFFSLIWHETVLHEKPPTLFFVVGLFGGLFGFSDTVVLLPNVIAAFLSLTVLRAIVRDLGYSSLLQGLAILIMLSSSTFVFYSRRVMADPLFLLFMLCFMWAWFRLQIFPNTGRVRTMRVLAGTCLGLAVLTKWIFAVLPVLAITGWHMGRFLKPRKKDVFVVGAIAFLVAAPWHIIQTFEYGSEFWKTYAGYHVFERAASSLVSPSDPGLYFRTIYGENTVLLLGLIPALYFLFTSRGIALRRVAAPLVMLLIVFAPIQFSSTRMEHYLLPILPLMVLVGVDAWSRLIDINRMTFVVPLLTALLSIILWVNPRAESADFSPGSQAACKAGSFDDPKVLVVNHYDVATTWHCRRPIRMHTDIPVFMEKMQGIDMLYRTKAVVLMEPEALETWIRKHPEQPIVTRRGWGERHLEWSPAEGRNVEVDGLLERLDEKRPRRLQRYRDADVLFPAEDQP